MTEERVWYVNTNDQTYGPYTREEIISMLRDENIQYSDYIFKEGFANWDFIYNIPEFDRRLIHPGGDQPKVEAPHEEVHVKKEEEKAAEVKKGEILWYVHDGEHQTGPYSEDYVRESLEDKTIFWTYYVWRDGLDNWVQLKDCKEFDRRKTPRGEKPKDTGITTNYNEIKKQAVHSIPTVDTNKELYGEAQVPGNYQYGLTEADQEELRGKYPVKAILFLVGLAIVLFGAVRFYPKFVQYSRAKNKESKAESVYNKAQKLIEHQKLEEGYEMLFDLMDMYPGTKAARRDENDILAKAPFVKEQFADEGKKIKSLMDDYIRKYGMLPNNAVDISFVPSFWLKYFGDAYYKRDFNGKVAVMIKGRKMPVEEYLFTVDGNNKVTESGIKASDFEIQNQAAIRLAYTGTKTVIRPPDVPQLLKKKEFAPTPPPPPPTVKEPVPVKKPAKKAIKKTESTDEQDQDEQVNSDDDAVRTPADTDEQPDNEALEPTAEEKQK